MKKCFSMIIALVMVFTMMPTGVAFVNADTGVDVTAPVINSLTVNNADNVDASGNLSVTIDVTEGGTGVWYMNFWYESEDGHEVSLTWSGVGINAGTDPLIFTGKQTINIPIENKFSKGNYQLKTISITDRSENNRYYNLEDFMDANITGDLIVTKSSNTDISAPIINSLSVNQGNSVDASGNLSITIDVTEDGTGIWYMYFHYKSEEGHEVSLGWASEGINNGTGPRLYTGKNTITVPIESKLSKGKYKLQSITVADRNENFRQYNPEDFEYSNINGDITVTKSSNTDVIAPIITSAKILKSNIQTPDLLTVQMDIKEDGGGVWYMYFWFENQYGHTKNLVWSGIGVNNGTAPLLKTGTHKISFPVSPFFGEGNYKLTNITLADRNENFRYYNKTDVEEGSKLQAFNTTVSIKSNFDIAYFGSTSNTTQVINAIKAMPEGDTAVLDCRSNEVASKAIFTAIAGKNKNVVFENDDIQWVFNGKKITASKCKDIKLGATISVVSGPGYGFPDEKKIIKIDFANNGKLPGKADIRINDDYLAEKYGGTSKKLVLSYMNKKVPQTEASSAKVAKDEATEFEIDHNSTYMISGKRARLIKTKVTAKATNLTSIKLSWKKVPGAKNYVLYRATSKKGKYKKIKTLSASSTSYTNKKLKTAKKYYYKVKAVGGDSSIKSVTSAVVSAKPALKAPAVKVSKAKNLKSATVKWGKIKGAKSYVIYRASKENGKYKKVGTTTKAKFVDKKVKKNKTYYYKVVAKHKKSSYSSAKSAAAVVKMKK